jgi:hypothetical protein
VFDSVDPRAAVIEQAVSRGRDLGAIDASLEERGIGRDGQAILLSASASGNGATTMRKPSSLRTNSRRQTEQR